MTGVAVPSVRCFARFRRPIVGLIAHSLLAGCSQTQSSPEGAKLPVGTRAAAEEAAPPLASGPVADEKTRQDAPMDAMQASPAAPREEGKRALKSQAPATAASP